MTIECFYARITPKFKEGDWCKVIDLKRNNFKLFCFFVLIILGIPIILNVLFLCKAGPDGWASYFGSYLGGLLGGVATFLGVYITIKNNKEEQDRKVKIERLEKILNSAIIISFDLGFLHSLHVVVDGFRGFVILIHRNALYGVKHHHAVLNETEAVANLEFCLDFHKLKSL